MVRVAATLLLAAALVCAGGARVGAAGTAEGPSEYQVKGAFLYNFMKFVEWPEGAFTDPVVVAVLGPAPVDQIEEAFRGKLVRGRRVVVQAHDGADRPPRCHLLFIASDARGQLRAALRAVAGTPVLTVSDVPEAAEPEAVINLVAVDTRLGFQVNLDLATASGLQISSKLLGLAKTVRGGAGRAR